VVLGGGSWGRGVVSRSSGSQKGGETCGPQRLAQKKGPQGAEHKLYKTRSSWQKGEASPLERNPEQKTLEETHVDARGLPSSKSSSVRGLPWDRPGEDSCRNQGKGVRDKRIKKSRNAENQRGKGSAETGLPQRKRRRLGRRLLRQKKARQSGGNQMVVDRTGRPS